MANKKNELDDLIVKLEETVNTYAKITKADSPELKDNVKAIRSWVDKQIESDDEAKAIKNIENVGKALQTSVTAVNDLIKGNYLQGGLKLVGTIAVLAGGPYGALAGAACGVISSVISANSPGQPDMGTQLSGIVRDELLKSNQQHRVERLDGLQNRVRNINIALKNIKEVAKRHPYWWTSGESKNPCKKLVIPDEDLFRADFPQFIGEEETKLDKGLTLESSEAEVNDCIASLVSYCNAQAIYKILLGNVMATFEMTGHDTKTIKELLKSQDEKACAKLEMTADGSIPSQRGRITMFYRLRNNVIAYNFVQPFRDSLELKPIPDPEQARRYAEFAAKAMPVDILFWYQQPERKDKDHYFQLINHTDYPIKIFSDGNPNLNNLKFQTDVQAKWSYERAVEKSPLMSISSYISWVPWVIDFGWARGYFIIYLDGKLPSEDPLKSEKCRVFEFALSNAGSVKINVIDKSADATSATGDECEKQMKDDKPPAIFFSVGKSHYVVYAKINSSKKGYKTWRFVVQKYDVNDRSNNVMKQLLSAQDVPSSLPRMRSMSL